MSAEAETYDALIIGAGGGIGRALTQHLLDDRRISSLHLTAREPAAAGLADNGSSHVSVHQHALDITDPASVQALAQALQDADSTLRLVINTAGILHGDGFGPERRLQDIDLAAMQRVLTTNCIGHALVLSALQPLLPRHGKIVLASLSARVGSISDNRLGGWYSYRASKAALNQIIRTAAIELKRHNSDSVCIGLHPGTVDTGLSKPFQNNVPAQQLFSPEQAARQLLDVIEQRRPDDTGKIFAWDGEPIPA